MQHISTVLRQTGGRRLWGKYFIGGTKSMNEFQGPEYRRQFVQVAAAVTAPLKYIDVPCPQGVQGDDCEKFKIWLENCQKFNLNCDKDLQGVQSGKITVSEIFADQEKQIKAIVDDFERGTNVYEREVLNTDHMHSPQGIQGMDCERYKMWLDNCTKYGFTNCKDQIQGVQEGRKSLSDIFEEQQRLITKIVHNHQQKRFFSTTTFRRDNKTSGQGEPEVSSAVVDGTNTPENTQALTQRQRLKRAVKEYGATVVIFHVGISLLSLGGFYLAVSSGIDVVGLLSKAGVGESILQSKAVTGASTFVVAYAVHKVFAPVRIAITLTSTPIIVHRLRKIGFLKTPVPK